MIITNNVPALQSTANLNKSNRAIAKSMNNLSIGTKINSARDDAAGMAIANKLRAQVKGLETASQNSHDGVSLIQTAEGALSEMHAMLQRMRELSVQAANDTNVPEDRNNIRIEYEALRDEITQVSARTEYNKIKILSGELYKYEPGDEQIYGMPEYAFDDMIADLDANGIVYDTLPDDEQREYYIEYAAEYLSQFDKDLTLQVGANQYMEFNFPIPKITSSTLMITPWTIPEPHDYDHDDNAYELSHERAVNNLSEIDRAINIVSQVRARMGAAQNRLEHTVLSLDTTALNTDRARSRIEDTDMALETTKYTSKNVIAQAAIAIIAQANQRPQMILQLM